VKRRKIPTKYTYVRKRSSSFAALIPVLQQIVALLPVNLFQLLVHKTLVIAALFQLGLDALSVLLVAGAVRTDTFRPHTQAVWNRFLCRFPYVRSPLVNTDAYLNIYEWSFYPHGGQYIRKMKKEVLKNQK